jgi:hypothetical protein
MINSCTDRRAARMRYGVWVGPIPSRWHSKNKNSLPMNSSLSTRAFAWSFLPPQPLSVRKNARAGGRGAASLLLPAYVCVSAQAQEGAPALWRSAMIKWVQVSAAFCICLFRTGAGSTSSDQRKQQQQRRAPTHAACTQGAAGARRGASRQRSSQLSEAVRSAAARKSSGRTGIRRCT